MAVKRHQALKYLARESLRRGVAAGLRRPAVAVAGEDGGEETGFVGGGVFWGSGCFLRRRSCRGIWRRQDAPAYEGGAVDGDWGVVDWNAARALGVSEAVAGE